MIVLLGAFEAMSSLRTMETREMLQRFLAEPPGSSLGFDFEGARRLRHGAILVLGACAAAAAILGFFALRRDRAARVALSVLAVPLFLSGSIAGGFASAVVTVSIVMLWLEPARSWFAGRPLPERFRLPREGARDDRREQRRDTSVERGGAGPYLPPHQPTRTPGPGPSQTAGAPGADDRSPDAGGPAAYQGFGGPPSGQGPWGQPGAPWGQPAAPTQRPPGVLLACVATWVATGFATLGALALAFVVATDRGLLEREILRVEPSLADGGDVGDLLVATTVFLVTVVVVWSVAAAVVAVFALRGQSWARILLMVSAGVSGFFSLIAVTSSVGMLLFAAAAVLTIVGLSRGEVSRWYAARGRMRS